MARHSAPVTSSWTSKGGGGGSAQVVLMRILLILLDSVGRQRFGYATGIFVAIEEPRTSAFTPSDPASTGLHAGMIMSKCPKIDSEPKVLTLSTLRRKFYAKFVRFISPTPKSRFTRDTEC
jgi:hypothetical protein